MRSDHSGQELGGEISYNDMYDRHSETGQQIEMPKREKEKSAMEAGLGLGEKLMQGSKHWCRVGCFNIV